MSFLKDGYVSLVTAGTRKKGGGMFFSIEKEYFVWKYSCYC